MLRWRLILGPIIVVLLAALSWADVSSGRPGSWLCPFAVIVALFCAQETIRLLRASGAAPAAWSIYAAVATSTVAASAPIAWRVYPADCPVGRLGWLACGLAISLLMLVAAELRRYTEPGRSIANLAGGALATLYVGGLIGFLVQLRLLPVGGEVTKGGMLALLSMIIVVKITDIGAYTFGRLFGRHKMAPTLSPGKTWEGVAGGLVFAVIGSMIALGPLANVLEVELSLWGVAWAAVSLIYGLVVGIAGILGDLTESMLKRDAGVKDSSDWLPGFGGVLDLLDSLLFAAPIAYICWVSGMIA